MTSSTALRETAERVRDHAREYDPAVARPLLAQAEALEFEAALLERAGRERRGRRLTAREQALLPARRAFGRAQR